MDIAGRSSAFVAFCYIDVNGNKIEETVHFSHHYAEDLQPYRSIRFKRRNGYFHNPYFWLAD